MKPSKLQFQRGESVHAGIIRLTRLVVSEAIRVIRHPSPDRAEDVHQVRLCTKRLRATLRLVRSPANESVFEGGYARLRAAALGLALSRDYVVARKTVAKLLRTLEHRRKRKALKALGSAIKCQAPGGAGFRRHQEAALVQAARELKKVGRSLTEIQLAVDGWPAVGPGLRNSSRKVRAWLLVAMSLYRDRDCHEARKWVKHLYFQLLLVEAAWPRRIRMLCRHLRRMGAHLGDVHDLTVVKNLLSTAPQCYGGGQSVKLCTECLTERRARLRVKIRRVADRLLDGLGGHFHRRLAGHWAAWNTR